MNETICYLKSILKENDTIVIGLSGGPDSMCLLDILKKLPIKLNIICAHINHNIREESKEECIFVKEYCKKNNLIFETITFDKKSNEENYNEQELREKRYKYFEELIKKYNAKYLMTAHHGDDLIETILMRLTRGSNLKGYSGFQVETQKENYKIIKPLIYTTKENIEEYNKENNIPYAIDKTNETNIYTRNRYRHNVLPFLKEENKDIHLKYLKFSKELNKYYQYVDKEVKKELSNRYKKNILNIEKFNEIDNLIKTKMIEYILDKNYIDNLYLVNDKHVNMILDVINNPRPNIEINLPNELKIVKSYNEIKIKKNVKKNDEYNIKLEEITTLPNGHTIEFIKESKNNSNYEIKLNSKKIKLPLYVRTRQKGDKMTIKNMTDAKKVKDIFINSKLSKELRDTQPIVVDSNGEILWIPGLKKSKFDETIKENYDIILWYN